MKEEINNTEYSEADKIRVLQAAKWCHPYIGGIERVVEDIADGMKKRAEMTILVCADGRKTEIETRPDGVTVIRAGTLGKLFSMPISLRYLYWFGRLSQKADIIQFHAPFPLSDLALFLHHNKNAVKTVWWHSDVVRQKKLMMVYKPLMRWFLKNIDRIYVAGNAILEQSKYIGEHRERVEIIPFGLNVEEYESNPFTPILTEKLRDKKNKKVLFVGRLVSYKGVEVLLNAFRGIEGAELFIVGDGDLRVPLKRQANALSCAERIHFLGSLETTDLRSAYRDCDFFVLPSVTRAECFGIVQLEAMVYGKPVINTGLETAVPEVSLNGISGITVEPCNVKQLHEAIKRLCADDELRERLGRGAKERIHNFYNLRVMADKLYASYSELYNEKNNLELSGDE